MIFRFFCESNVSLWDSQIIACCFYLHFTQHANRQHELTWAKTTLWVIYIRVELLLLNPYIYICTDYNYSQCTQIITQPFPVSPLIVQSRFQYATQILLRYPPTPSYKTFLIGHGNKRSVKRVIFNVSLLELLPMKPLCRRSVDYSEMEEAARHICSIWLYPDTSELCMFVENNSSHNDCFFMIWWFGRIWHIDKYPPTLITYVQVCLASTICNYKWCQHCIVCMWDERTNLFMLHAMSPNLISFVPSSLHYNKRSR